MADDASTTPVVTNESPASPMLFDDDDDDTSASPILIPDTPENPCIEMINSDDVEVIQETPVHKQGISPYDVDTDLDTDIDDNKDEENKENVPPPTSLRKPALKKLRLSPLDGQIRSPLLSVLPETPGGTPKTIVWPEVAADAPSRVNRAKKPFLSLRNRRLFTDDEDSEDPEKKVSNLDILDEDTIMEDISSPPDQLNDSFLELFDGAQPPEDEYTSDGLVDSEDSKATTHKTYLNTDFGSVIDDGSIPMADRLMAISFLAIQDLAKANPSSLTGRLATIKDNFSRT